MEFIKTKVNNMTGRTGRNVPNQFEIATDQGIFFQSYDSVIAFKPFDREKAFYAINKVSSANYVSKKLKDFNLKNDIYPMVYLDSKYWDYSTTTGKYRNEFLGENKKETMNKIKNGQYQLINLN